MSAELDITKAVGVMALELREENRKLKQLNADMLAALEAVAEEGHAHSCRTWESIEGAVQFECDCSIKQTRAIIKQAKGETA